MFFSITFQKIVNVEPAPFLKLYAKPWCQRCYRIRFTHLLLFNEDANLRLVQYYVCSKELYL